MTKKKDNRISGVVPSVNRVLKELQPVYKNILLKRYLRIIPILLSVLRSQDILARNRTWPGISPVGKQAAKLITSNSIHKLRICIDEYAVANNEQPDELWQLVRAYCRYGPIGLIDALPSPLPTLISDEIQECASFYRLAKHPRSDMGLHIRSLLGLYAVELGLLELSSFVARYAWASDRKTGLWYIGESERTEHVPKSVRRLNLDQSYPHQRWRAHIAVLPFNCSLTTRHQISVNPWLIWMIDEFTGTLMGFRICPVEPTLKDILLTLRWSIWHNDASWWTARGAPDILELPDGLGVLDEDSCRALHYTRTKLQFVDADKIELQASTKELWIDLPEKVVSWLQFQKQRLSVIGDLRWTIADIRTTLLDLVYETAAQAASSIATPNALIERQCSLPWNNGIAGALLLPRVKSYTIFDQCIDVYGVSYHLVGQEISNSIINIHYDPDDARHIFVIHNGAHVIKMPARAFEHPMTWYELVGQIV